MADWLAALSFSSLSFFLYPSHTHFVDVRVLIFGNFISKFHRSTMHPITYFNVHLHDLQTLPSHIILYSTYCTQHDEMRTSTIMCSMCSVIIDCFIHTHTSWNIQPGWVVRKINLWAIISTCRRWQNNDMMTNKKKTYTQNNDFPMYEDSNLHDVPFAWLNYSS